MVPHTKYPRNLGTSHTILGIQVSILNILKENAFPCHGAEDEEHTASKQGIPDSETSLLREGVLQCWVFYTMEVIHNHSSP